MKKATVSLATIAIILFVHQAIAQAGVIASAFPEKENVVSGQEIVVPVSIDMSGTSELLGSFTGNLTWDPSILKYEEHSSLNDFGFSTPMVNNQHVGQGKLLFAAANPRGASGKVKILNVKFRVIGKAGSKIVMDLHFSAMAAARTFKDLLPVLTLKTADKNHAILVKKGKTGGK
ncbi:MAG: hypothetical protein GXO75_20175 [Calditrichaeota bacterium]|nr:hypothetical protein [Calditrichota bacterium]